MSTRRVVRFMLPPEGADAAAPPPPPIGNEPLPPPLVLPPSDSRDDLDSELGGDGGQGAPTHDGTPRALQSRRRRVVRHSLHIVNGASGGSTDAEEGVDADDAAYANGMSGGVADVASVDPEAQRARTRADGAGDDDVVATFTRKARPEEEVAVESVVAYLEHSIRKTSSAVGFFPHLLLLVLVSVHVAFDVSDSSAPTREAAATNLLRGASGSAGLDLSSVISLSDFQSFVLNAISSLVALEQARITAATLGQTADTLYSGGIVVRVFRNDVRSEDPRTCSDSSSGLLTDADVMAAGSASCVTETAVKTAPNASEALRLANAIYLRTVASGASNAIPFIANTTSTSPHLYLGRAVSGRYRLTYPALTRATAVAGWSTAQLILPLPVGLQYIETTTGAALTLNRSTSTAVERQLLGYAALELQNSVSSVFSYAPHEIIGASMEVLQFSRESSTCVAATAIYERNLDMGAAHMIYRPFSLRQPASGGSNETLFALFVHSFGVLMVVLFLLESVREIRLNLELSENCVARTRAVWATDAEVDDARSATVERPWLERAASAWVIFDIGFTALYVVFVYVYYSDVVAERELTTWSRSNYSSDPRLVSVNTFALLMRQGDDEFTERRLYAFVLVCLFVRTFRYLAYSDRVSLINTTMYTAVHNIISLLILAAIILTAFAYGGVLLWSPGDPINGFSSLESSFSYLFQFMLNGNADFNIYQATDRTSAVLYFGGVFVLIWMLLLNVVVGIFSLAFAALTEMSMMAERQSWSPGKVVKDLGKWLLRTGLGAALFPKSAQAGYLEKRRKLLVLVRLWQAQGIENMVSAPTNISLQRMLQYTQRSIADPAFVRKVFAKAQQQLGEPSAIERRQRGLQRGADRGRVMQERMAEQLLLVEALFRRTVIQRGASDKLKALQAAGPEMTVMEYDVRAASTRVSALSTSVAKDATQVRRAGFIVSRVVELLAAVCRELATASHVLVVHAPAAAMLANGMGPPDSDVGMSSSPLSRSGTQSSILSAGAATGNAGSGVQSPIRSQSFASPSAPPGGGGGSAFAGGRVKSAATVRRALLGTMSSPLLTGARRTTSTRVSDQVSQVVSRLRALKQQERQVDPAVKAIWEAEQAGRTSLQTRLLQQLDLHVEHCLAHVGVEFAEATARSDLYDAKERNATNIERSRQEKLEKNRTEAADAIRRRKAALLSAAALATPSPVPAVSAQQSPSISSSPPPARTAAVTPPEEGPAAKPPLTPTKRFAAAATAVHAATLLQRKRVAVVEPKTSDGDRPGSPSAGGEQGAPEETSAARRARATVYVTHDGRVTFDTTSSVVQPVSLAVLQQRRVEEVRRMGAASAHRSRVFTAARPSSSPDRNL